MTDYKFWYAWCDKEGVVNEFDTLAITGQAQYWTAADWDKIPKKVENFKDTHIWVGVLVDVFGSTVAYSDPESFIRVGRAIGILPKY